ncbi:jg22260, partial [Pararge aegeria aegeria]
MFLQGRVIIVWLSWLIGGVCGVVILLIIICYCRLMPRHQKSFGKQLVVCKKVRFNDSQLKWENLEVPGIRTRPPKSGAEVLFTGLRHHFEHSACCALSYLHFLNNAEELNLLLGCMLLDEQYLKEHYTIKEGHGYSGQDSYRLKHA